MLKVRRRGRRATRRSDNPRRKVGSRVIRRRMDDNARGWFRSRGGKRYGRRGIRTSIRGSRRFSRPTRKTYRRRVVVSNPPRRRKYGRRSFRRYDANPRRRHYRRRRVSNNPRRSFRLLDNPLKVVTDTFKAAFSGDTIETVFHTILGFGGTAVGSRLVFKKVIPSLGESAVGRVGSTLGVSLLGGAILGGIGGAKLGARAVVGGLLATAWQILSEVLPAEAKEFIPTLGADSETDAFRKAIEAEVVKELKGRGAEGYIPPAGQAMSVYIPPAGVTYIPAAGSATYLTQSEAARSQRAGAEGYLTQRELERADAGMGTYEGEFSAATMPERF